MNAVPAGDLKPSSLCPVCDYDTDIAASCPECGSALPADLIVRAKIQLAAKYERLIWLLIMIGAALTSVSAWLSLQVAISIRAFYSETPRTRSIALWEELGALAIAAPPAAFVFIAWRLRRGVRKRRLRTYERTSRVDSWFEVVGTLLVPVAWAFPLVLCAWVLLAILNG